MSWRATSGSVRGSEHARLNRNNQDSVWVASEGGVVAVAVTDGCSEGTRSEVGAQLAAGFIAPRACRLATDVWGPALAERLTDELARYFESVARAGGAGDAGDPREGAGARDATLESFVQDKLMTTFVCVVAQGEQVLVFGVGDGVVCIDGEVRVLDPGPDNAPPYVAYRMLPDVGADAAVRVHHDGPARKVAIATDGARAALPLIDASFGWKNPQALQRALNVTKGLHDDTTIALLEAAP